MLPFPEQCRNCNHFLILLLDGFCAKNKNNPLPISEEIEIPKDHQRIVNGKICCKFADYQTEFDFVKEKK